MSVWSALSAPMTAIAVGLATILIAPVIMADQPLDQRALVLGVIAAGVPSVIFPIVMLIAGPQKVSVFGGCIMGSSLLRMIVTVFAAFGLTRLDLQQPGAMLAGVLAVATGTLIAEKIAAVLVLRPTWESTNHQNNPAVAGGGVDSTKKAANAGVASNA